MTLHTTARSFTSFLRATPAESLADGEVGMRKGRSTAAAGAEAMNDSSTKAPVHLYKPVPGRQGQRETGKLKPARAFLTVSCRMSDELLFAMLFVVAIAALLPSVWW